MSIMDLWLPIVVSAVLAFFASFLVWMVLPYHRKDWSPVSDEDAFLADLGKQKLAPGNYTFPHLSDPGQMQDEAWKGRYEAGPVGFLTIKAPGPFSMNKELGLWFVYLLVVSVAVAYVTSRTIGHDPDPSYLAVFRVSGTSAFLAYSGAIVPQGIWKSLNWSTVWKEVFDGLFYALLTAGSFAWLAI